MNRLAALAEEQKKQARLKMLELNTLAAKGDSAKVIALSRAYLETYGADAEVFNQYANAKKITAEDSALIKMHEEDAANTQAGRQKKEIFYALGKCYEDLGNPEKAAANFDRANQIAIAKDPFKRDAIKYLTEANIDYYGKKGINIEHGNKSTRPIFILGLPRSGTSLAEQVLCTNKDVFGCGELGAIQDIIINLTAQNKQGQIMRYPYTLNFVDKGYYNYAGETYLAAVSKINNTAKYTVDKMPPNYLYAGFIREILPNAKIIHCKRDPRDVALSMYFTPFSNIGLSYSNSWDEIIFVVEEYFKLAEFWKAKIPEMFELRYSSIINDFDNTVQKLLAYCGFDNDGSYANFHEVERPVTTASRFQVRRPIYKTSSGKWQKYEPYYGKYFSKIEALAKQYGFEEI